MTTPINTEPTPGYRVHRVVLIAVVLIAVAMFGLFVALQVPALALWLRAVGEQTRLCWLEMHWSLF